MVLDMANNQFSLTLDSNNSIPLYLQLAEKLTRMIYEHRLQPGDRLPPERNLAELCNVSRTTVINAYRHMEDQELVVSKVGSGTFVAASFTSGGTTVNMPWEQMFAHHPPNPMASILRELVGTPSAADYISLAAGMPDPALYPTAQFHDLWMRHFTNLDRSEMGHIPTEGYLPLRQTIAQRDYLKGIPVTAQNVMILSGSQQGLYLITRSFIEPGDYVIMESPTFIGAIQAFQAAGARILSLPVMDTFPMELLEDYLTRYRPKLFYTVPTFQNPTGRVLNKEERYGILHLASRYRMMVLEDDPYGDLYYDAPPPPSLAELDEYGCVLYLSTFSKVIFPGLRIGWLDGPPIVINRLAQEKQYIDLHCNNLTQWLLTKYLQEGRLDHHLQRVRKEYKQRRDIMADSIHRQSKGLIEYVVPGGGFYLWCRLHCTVSSRVLMQEASRIGVGVVAGEAFYPEQQGHNEIRLCFASHDKQTLSEAIKRLSKLLERLQKTGTYHNHSYDLGKPII